MSHNKSASPIALPTEGGGSNMGLYIGLGAFLLIAAGGVGYYMYSSSKKKEEEEKKKAAAAAAADANKVPLMVNGKPVKDKDGNPIMVDPSAVQAGKPVVGDDGKPVTGSDGKPVVPSAADVKAVAAAADSTGGGGGTGVADASAGGAKSNAYVQGATIDKRNANTDYKGWTATSSDDGAFKQAVSDLLGLAPAHKKLKKRQKKENERAAAALADAITYVRGFLKGINVAPNSNYVGIFGQAISDYMNNPAKMKESAVDKVGYFLTTKEGQTS